MLKNLIYLILVAFVIALIHSCSLHNNVIVPPCKVFRGELIERWWQAEGATDDPKMAKLYFTVDGDVKFSGGSSDEVTFELVECNKVEVNNKTAASIATWEVERIEPEVMILITANGTISYK